MGFFKVLGSRHAHPDNRSPSYALRYYGETLNYWPSWPKSARHSKIRFPNAFIFSCFEQLKMAGPAALPSPAALAGPGQAILAYP
jgi:hypothetical protein